MGEGVTHSETQRGGSRQTDGDISADGDIPAAERRAAVTGPAIALLHSQFEELGLSPSESRVLVALLQVGSATAPELSRLSGVPRTNTYPVIESLRSRHLAERVPGTGPGVWAAPRREEIVPQLEAAIIAQQEERLLHHRMQAAIASEAMAKILVDAPSVSQSYVRILSGPAQAGRVYDQMVLEARELVVCNRPPYTHDRRFTNPAVLEAVERGMQARALYEVDQWNDPAAEPFRRASDAYHQAGVEWRLAESLPIKMAVADRKVAIVSLTSPNSSGDDLEVTVHVEHPDYAEAHALVFDDLWASATPGELAEPAITQALGGDLAG